MSLHAFRPPEVKRNPRTANCRAAEDAYLSMGETSENVAERFGVARRDQDVLAAMSHNRAAQAPTATADVYCGRPSAGHGAARRGFSLGRDRRAPGQTAASVPQGRHHHGRQQLANQRRRRAGHVDEAQRGTAPRSAAAGRAAVVRGGRRRSVGDGHRPGGGHPQGAADGRHRHAASGPIGDQRGVWIAGGVLCARAGRQPRCPQRERRCHRARPPAGHDRRTLDHHAVARAGSTSRSVRRGEHVYRHGHGGGGGV
eukprot:ctg_586.g305